MLTLIDIRGGLSGAWRLFRGDPKAMDAFDLSYDGFWKSFLAILVALPVFLLYVHGEWSALSAAVERAPDAQVAAPSFAAHLVLRLAVMAVDWLAFPLIVLATAGPLGIAGRVVPYIIAQNWAAAAASVVIALPGIAFAYSLLGAGVASLVTFVLFLLVLRFFYLVARIALGAPVGLAVGLVAFNALLSLLIGELSSRLF